MKGVGQIKPWYQEAFKAVNGTLLYEEEAAFQAKDIALLVGRCYFNPVLGYRYEGLNSNKSGAWDHEASRSIGTVNEPKLVYDGTSRRISGLI